MTSANTECNYYKDCNSRLQKLIKKMERELCKADETLLDYKSRYSKLINIEPNKHEKQKVIDCMKKSVSCSTLLEELRMHRKEVKQLLRLSKSLVDKYEKLNCRKTKQIEEVASLNSQLKENRKLHKLMLKSSLDLKRMNLMETQENKRLEKIFNEMIAQVPKLLTRIDCENRVSAEYLNRVTREHNESQYLFGFIIKYTKRAFDFIAGVRSARVNFMDYVYSNDFGSTDPNDVRITDNAK